MKIINHPPSFRLAETGRDNQEEVLDRVAAGAVP